MTVPAHLLDGAKRGHRRDGGRTETDLVYAILSYLAARRVRARRQNTGGLKVPDSRKRRGYRYVAFGEEGNPDISGWVRAWGGMRFSVPILIECKTEHGKTDRVRLAKQTARIREAQADGCIAFFAHSIAEVAEQLDAYGVPGLDGRVPGADA